MTGNMTSQLSDSLRGRFAFNNSWSRQKGLLPSLERHRPGRARTTARRRRSRTGRSRATWTGWRRPSLFFGIRGGYYLSDRHDTERDRGAALQLADHQQRRPARRAGEPAAADRVLERAVEQRRSLEDKQTRAYFQADGTVYGKLGGDAPAQVRRQADRLGNDVDTGEARRARHDPLERPPVVELRDCAGVATAAAPTATTRSAASGRSPSAASSPRATST